MGPLWADARPRCRSSASPAASSAAAAVCPPRRKADGLSRLARAKRSWSAGVDEVVPFVSVIDAPESKYPARAAASATPTQDVSAQLKLTRSERRLLRVLQAAGANGVYQDELQARGEVASEEAIRAHMKRMRRKLAVVGLDITPMEGRYRLVRLLGA